MPEPTVDVARYARSVWRRLRVTYRLIGGCALLVGLLSAAWTHYWMVRMRLAPELMCAFAWLSAATVVLVTGAGTLLATRRSRLRALVRSNMLALFADQRKDLGAWLSHDLIGPHQAATRVLLERRLARSLPRTWTLRLNSGPLASLLAAVTAALLAVLGLCLQPRLSLYAAEAYVRRILMLQTGEPLRVVTFAPASTWFRKGRPVTIEVNFGRQFETDPLLLIRTENERNRLPLALTESGSYRVAVPPQTRDFSVVLRALGSSTPAVQFRAFPDAILTLDKVEVRSHTGTLLTTHGTDDFPLRIPEGSQLNFHLTCQPCPVTGLAIAGDMSGELPLTATGEPLRYVAHATITVDEAFSLFWQLPDTTIQTWGDYRVECIADGAPAVTLSAPVDGRAYATVPHEIVIECVGRDDVGIEECYVYCSDYTGLDVVRKVAVKRTGPERYLATLKLSPSDIRGRHGRVLGICAAMVDNSAARHVAFSEIANVILPAADLNQGDSKAMDEFWQNVSQNDQRDATERSEEDKTVNEELLALASSDTERGENSEATAEPDTAADDRAGKPDADGQQEGVDPDRGQQQQEQADTAQTKARGDRPGQADANPADQAPSSGDGAPKQPTSGTPDASPPQDTARAPAADAGQQASPTAQPGGESARTATDTSPGQPDAAASTAPRRDAETAGTSPASAAAKAAQSGQPGQGAQPGSDPSATPPTEAARTGVGAAKESRPSAKDSVSPDAAGPQPGGVADKHAQQQDDGGDANRQARTGTPDDDVTETSVDVVYGKKGKPGRVEPGDDTRPAQQAEDDPDGHDGDERPDTADTAGRQADATFVNSIQKGDAVGRNQLSASDWEELIRQFEQVRDRLSPDEDSIVEDYYRMLRDIK